MFEHGDFRQLVRLVRAGDAAAAADLVRLYEPAIRRTVRIRLRGGRLGRVLDSQDICQSVLLSFFTRAALGQYELDTPNQLLRLLTAMARYKLSNATAHEQAQCRDLRRVEAGDIGDRQLPAPDGNPCGQAALAELVAKFRDRLSAEELQLVELRREGRGWTAVAAALGGSAEALRKKLARILNRVARELGLEEVSSD